MVRGIDHFRDYFRNDSEKYILIGGTACDIAMNRMGLKFRATKDLDIVLIIEALDSDFGNLLWAYIKEGNYRNRQKSTGKTEFYRFYKPEKDDFPYMLEFFARKPDAMTLPSESHLTPIPLDEGVSSLSAILLNTDYYDFILAGKVIEEGLSIIPELYLIPMKAKACLDLLQLKDSGGHVDSKDIKKHKNDVFRLYQILTSESSIELPRSIADDMSLFLKNVSREPPDLKNLGIRNTTLDEIIENLSKIYHI
jgi:hypothetical protein